MSRRSPFFTKREVARRHLDLRARLLLTLPPDELAAAMLSPKPMAVPDLIRLAQRRAAEHADKCPNCGHPLLIGRPARVRKPRNPSMPIAHAREVTTQEATP